MNEYIEIFKALGDETRLRIMHLLMAAENGLCVCELVDSLEVPQYNVSKHLKVLKQAGLITERKEGRWVYYLLPDADEPFMQALFDTLALIPRTLVARDERELKKRLRLRVGGKCLIGIQKERLLPGRTAKRVR
ncbi:MAG: metalloregulator ArsR/SmtB family transcription factor [Acidobacteriota bacterium]|nr:metalloregulator ArsR/SmtB family transcription factor [Blastocatellia bacterium]MDW8239750.1 metalloregulator ArsR/SmtB family transcription factor [Acidobacteriota bacterium]